MKSLDRPLRNEETFAHLFARYLDDGLFNYNKLQNLIKELSVFISQWGISPLFGKQNSTNNLGLKLGCPVMLINKLKWKKNNALCGTVAKLHTDIIKVKFIVQQKVVPVTSKVIFTIHDSVDKNILAKRVQHLMLLYFLLTTWTNKFH